LQTAKNYNLCIINPSEVDADLSTIGSSLYGVLACSTGFIGSSKMWGLLSQALLTLFFKIE